MVADYLQEPIYSSGDMIERPLKESWQKSHWVRESNYHKNVNFKLDINNTVLGKLGVYSSEWSKTYKGSVYSFPTFNEVLWGIQQFFNLQIEKHLDCYETTNEEEIDLKEVKQSYNLIFEKFREMFSNKVDLDRELMTSDNFEARNLMYEFSQAKLLIVFMFAINSSLKTELLNDLERLVDDDSISQLRYLEILGPFAKGLY